MKLEQSPRFPACPGPVVTIVLDGVGLSPREDGDAIKAARTPMLDKLMTNFPMMALCAHGTAVGMPSDDDMGNSEVGHNAIGAGRVFAQGAKLVAESIASGHLWQGQSWREVVATAQQGGTLHFIGLFSDGNVHSHIDHLKAMIERAKQQGVGKVRLHILLDGRDVGETSALDYVDPFEVYLDGLRSADFDVAIASGGGRMTITMDRYEAHWPMVERGWAIHVRGEGRQFASAHDAIVTYRNESNVIDQDLPGFVIAQDGQPLGPIVDGDAVVFFNFRGDRAIEISRAFTEASFTPFNRGPLPKITYAGMMQYDGDTKLPPRFLVEPPAIDRTLGEYLAKTGISQYAISETQKYGHVTYFWNGNRSGKFDEALETYVEIPSDVVPFEQRPWMKCAEITDTLIDAIRSGQYRYLRVNYANGDMVGHTGNFEAAVTAMQCLDLQLARLIPVIVAAGGVALVTADHGNADEMYELDKKGLVVRDAEGRTKAKTAHTLNPVPFILICGDAEPPYKLRQDMPTPGLSNIAATVLNLLGYDAPDDYDPSLIETA
ncbi:MAG: 2,3-bisphosphoglycerate-independent phosphoglycerate mutase [Methylomonas sp.]|nr:2,3-bisphosphoglycerate-independent phosphoglycerate mutase [Methylomonas sp.]PPD22921.1 MAG: phosphoglycerate mutase (2,3-diphosphoglycerate-independent) [Methylomonas sp.]PPD26471.1 MAG: phosphoglycerate mutase (2,3-diphosphoglycerate-independent) [Methylomonas sp.]PPD38239.1 MAG: phosphoglycerate mutase (2,3-diphosphoglycerate-independent) [Methylomonas sp.]PPD41956.1 MAG: phosphoglycerate mutase (2,3-diphosphoglycerate-independent) [Methylomonas sp.]